MVGFGEIVNIVEIERSSQRSSLISLEVRKEEEENHGLSGLGHGKNGFGGSGNLFSNMLGEFVDQYESLNIKFTWPI